MTNSIPVDFSIINRSNKFKETCSKAMAGLILPSKQLNIDFPTDQASTSESRTVFCRLEELYGVKVTQDINLCVTSQTCSPNSIQFGIHSDFRDFKVNASFRRVERSGCHARLPTQSKLLLHSELPRKLYTQVGNASWQDMSFRFPALNMSVPLETSNDGSLSGIRNTCAAQSFSPFEISTVSSSFVGTKSDPFSLYGGYHSQSCSDPPFKVSFPNQRVVAVGDLHGDWQQSVAALQLAGLISADGQCRWIGGSAVLVQVGDVLDRGEDEIALLSLLKHLDSQARQLGGAVFQVNGNHETMNVAEDFRYVTDEGFLESDSFLHHCTEKYGGNFEAAFERWWLDSQEIKNIRSRGSMWMWNPLQMQKRVKARSLLFGVGGPLACEMAKNPAVLQVNDSLFCHGGILPHHVEYGLDRINSDLSHWMRGDTLESGQPWPMPYLVTKGYNSVVWSRLYSRETYQTMDEKIKACSLLNSALEAAGAVRLVVGHTPQLGGANSECGGKVWRIDVGMSSGIMNAPPQVLEIIGSSVKVLGLQEQLAISSYT